jgi:hypothetical protein
VGGGVGVFVLYLYLVNSLSICIVLLLAARCTTFLNLHDLYCVFVKRETPSILHRQRLDYSIPYDSGYISCAVSIICSPSVGLDQANY